MQIPVLLPTVPGRAALWPYLGRIEQNRHYTNFGPLNLELESRLEKKFAEHAGCKLFVRTTASATLGLELALAALKLPAGSKVLIPALTFVATLTAVLNAGLSPVIADIDPSSWFLTPAIALDAAAAAGAVAVVAVATFGFAQDTQAWSAFQKSSGVHVIIDAAGAFGAQWVLADDIPVVFSMHATKSLPAGEGGFVVSGDKSIADLITQMSNFGINLDPNIAVPVGYLSTRGTNAKLSEYHSAVALASLDVWDQQALTRNALFTRYRTQLRDVFDSDRCWQSGLEPAAPTLFCVRAGSAQRRAALEATFALRGIATRRWYQPLLHKHAPGIGNFFTLPVPVAEEVATDLIGLPFFLDMNEAQLSLVVDTVHESLGVSRSLSTPPKIVRHG